MRCSPRLFDICQRCERSCEVGADPSRTWVWVYIYINLIRSPQFRRKRARACKCLFSRKVCLQCWCCLRCLHYGRIAESTGTLVDQIVHYGSTAAGLIGSCGGQLKAEERPSLNSLRGMFFLSLSLVHRMASMVTHRDGDPIMAINIKV